MTEYSGKTRTSWGCDRIQRVPCGLPLLRTGLSSSRTVGFYSAQAIIHVTDN